MQDQSQLEIETEQDCTSLVNLAEDLLFRKKDGVEHVLLAAADQNLTHPMLQLLTAIMYFFSFSKKVISEKVPLYLSRIAYGSLNLREKLYAKAVVSLVKPHFERSFDCFEKIIQHYPEDKVALLMLETCGFIGGIFHRLDLIYHQVAQDVFANDPDFLGMRAFLYCHLDKKNEARLLVLQALKYDPKNAWLHHVYAHTLDEKNNLERLQLVTFLETHQEDWSKHSQFFEGHNWMHLLVLQMKDQPLKENIFQCYEQHVWSSAKAASFEQNNAFLVLWSAELNEIVVPEGYWHDLASYTIIFTEDYFTPYLTVTSILALAKKNLTQAYVKAHCFEGYMNSLSSNSSQHKAWHIGLTILKGCLAYIQKNYRDAILYLEPVIEYTHLMGHSDEQRAIFRETLQKAKKMTGDL